MKSPVGKGPIIITIDESGSMQGEKAHTAKALALALAWIARQQNRWCALIAYSGDSGERLLALPPRRWNESALADWLTAFIGRTIESFGTDTRDDTLTRAAEKIRKTQFKIQAYAEYLNEAKSRLDRELAAARQELRAKVEHLATASVV